tara:strand:- start:737 stop:1222 length:486 start_codon:yes stop_codon:yes gene_type:complete
MPVQDNDSLRAQADRLAARHLNGLFQVPIVIEGVAEDSQWEPILQRQIYQRDYNVWAEVTELDVTLDAQGRITGFRDRWRTQIAADIAHDRSDDGTLLSIAETTGLVSPHARVIEVTLPETGPVEVRINQYVPGFPAWLTLWLDTVRAQVVALQVSMWDEP